MKKISYYLEKALSILVIVLTVSLVVDVSLQILGRYLFRMPLPWTEELARFLLVTIVTFSAPLTAKYDRYVRVDVVYTHLPKKVQAYYLPILDLLVAVFLFFVAYKALGLVHVGALQKTPVLKIPMSVAYSCMVICPALSGFYFSLNGIIHLSEVKSGNAKEKEDS